MCSSGVRPAGGASDHNLLLRTAAAQMSSVAVQRDLQYRNPPKDGSIGPGCSGEACYNKTTSHFDTAVFRKAKLQTTGEQNDRHNSDQVSSGSLYIYFKATSFVKYKYKL